LQRDAKDVVLARVKLWMPFGRSNLEAVQDGGELCQRRYGRVGLDPRLVFV
jgi:hypothetical protein